MPTDQQQYDNVEIKVLGAELKALATKVDSGFTDIKDLIKGSAISLNDHIKEDKEKFKDYDQDIEKLKLDMTKFKERWLLIGAAISLGGGAIIELLMHNVIK